MKPGSMVHSGTRRALTLNDTGGALGSNGVLETAAVTTSTPAWGRSASISKP